jgi:hypothetical protein
MGMVRKIGGDSGGGGENFLSQFNYFKLSNLFHRKHDGIIGFANLYIVIRNGSLSSAIR